MKLNSAGAWKLDYLKLLSITNKIFRGLITSGVLLGAVQVLSSTILPELKTISPTVSAIAGILLAELIEILTKLSKDYSK